MGKKQRNRRQAHPAAAVATAAAISERLLLPDVDGTAAFSELHLAVMHGNKRLLRHLLLQISSQGRVYATELLNRQDPQSGLTVLAIASGAGHTDVVRMLLKHGADPYVYDAQGVTPLMRAAAGGHTEVVRVLLEEGEADAFVLSDGEQTALMAAAAAGKAGCIKTLLQVAQVDVRQAGEQGGDHALLGAAAGGHLAAVRALLAHPGARVNQTDTQGSTALLLAARHGDLTMVRWLLRHGAKPGIPHFASGRTPLMEAACEGHLPVVQALLQHMLPAQIQAVDVDGRTAAQLAARPDVRTAVLQHLAHQPQAVYTQQVEQQQQQRVPVAVAGHC